MDKKSFHYKNPSSQVAIFLIISISFIFSYKYAARITDYSLYISTVYALLLFGIASYLLKRNREFNNKLLYSIIALYVVCIVISFFIIDPAKINVDRWSVISYFWDAARSGIYPYQSTSHQGNAPGPFPFYFLLALPFYFLGEIGYLSLSGLLVMLVGMNYYFKDDYKRKTAAIFLLVSSVAILWEMVARSTILINSALILLYLMWMVSNENHSWKQYAIMGVVGGLLLSTRGIYVIPIILCGAYCFLKPRRFKEMMAYGCSLMAVFIITFVPFFLWDQQLFIKYNPFTLQGDIIGRYLAVALIMISVMVGVLVKTEAQLYLGTGLMLYGAAFIYFINRLITCGFNPEFLQNNVDISYFIMALPFLLLSI
jgi:hypothetical protein